MNTQSNKFPFQRYFAWTVFLCYIFILYGSTMHHELWGDEVHSWNIANNSENFWSLIRNTRYEGHPPVWYTLLFIVSCFTHEPISMQWLNVVAGATIVALLLFRTRLPLFAKGLVPFGYYFLYEYTSFSRNYAIGVLFALALCLIIKGVSKYKTIWYYLFLFLLSNSHMLGMLMALAFQTRILFFPGILARSKREIHFLIGALVILPSLIFMFPPSDSGLNVEFWFSIWTKEQFSILILMPLKAFITIPAWWDYHFWNTNFLIAAQHNFHITGYVTALLSLGLLVALTYILWPDKQARLFFLVNLLLTLSVAFVFPLTNTRYVGYLFISFVISLCLCENNLVWQKGRKNMVALLLLIQVCGATVAITKDWRFPFSSAGQIKELVAKVPDTSCVVTDYWCLNYISAFTNKPYYCLALDKEKRFLLWNSEMIKLWKDKTIYSRGIEEFRRNRNCTEAYLISNSTYADILAKDSMFFRKYKVETVYAYYGAMEKYSNLFLYKIYLKKARQD